MQVNQISFSGIIKTNIPSENATKKPLSYKYEHLKEIENVLNGEPTCDYSDSEARKLAYTAQRIYKDYKVPHPDENKENNGNKGVYRISARDAIYYCTGDDIALAKAKQKELKDKNLSEIETAAKMQDFVDERTENKFGFMMIDQSKGTRYNVFGFGMGSKEKPFECEFIYF